MVYSKREVGNMYCTDWTKYRRNKRMYIFGDQNYQYIRNIHSLQDKVRQNKCYFKGKLIYEYQNLVADSEETFVEYNFVYK